MLVAEYSLSIFAQLLCISASIWVFFKVNRLAGFLMAFGFVLALAQMLVMTQVPDVVKFNFPESGEPTMFNSGLIVPIWYQVLVVVRTASQFGIPVGIYLAAKSHYGENT